jgi:hypothetical protein
MQEEGNVLEGLFFEFVEALVQFHPGGVAAPEID